MTESADGGPDRAAPAKDTADRDGAAGRDRAADPDRAADGDGAGDAGATGRSGRAVLVVTSLLGALVVPLLMALGGLASRLDTLGTLISLAIMLPTLVVGLVLTARWGSRAWPAICVFVLGVVAMIFGGSSMYELYMERFGDPVPAQVVEFDSSSSRSGEQYSCTVRETAGDRTTHELGGVHNCGSRHRWAEDVVLREDPLGVFKPRLEDGEAQPEASTTVTISACLLGGIGALILYSGLGRLRR
ncbi:hypothetical protein [Streptomyces sp. SBT349]|uniref:hypothetical protein n=1 Tax=Streptomyces sp. SBT349 TaxID=1580539 RepID=UPI00131B9443|nr:hypothetical protein [Streptomyces sp. SBT349]